MHLRRALLLFAIVIGLAALAASISQPTDDGEPPRTTTDTADEPATSPPSDTPTTTSETASPGDAEPRPRVKGQSVTLRASDQEAVRVPTGVPISLSVEVVSPGQVEIPGLGLTSPGEPLTPARFELLLGEPARYEVRFTGADADRSVAAGTVVAVDAER